MNKINEINYRKIASVDNENGEIELKGEFYKTEIRFFNTWNPENKIDFCFNNTDKKDVETIINLDKQEFTISKKIKNVIEDDLDSLTLCENAIVMLTVNYSKEKKLYNGSTGKVIGFDNKNPIIMFDDNVKHTTEKWFMFFLLKMKIIMKVIIDI